MKKIFKLITVLLLSGTAIQITAQEIEKFKDDAGVVEFNINNFESNLNHIRGVMTERNNQQQAIIARQHNQLDKTLHGFLQTEFMLKFKDLKIEAESLVSAFKAQAVQMPPADVARIKKAYIRIADQFNLQLVEIKRDFLDRDKMKMIRSNKEMYSNSLQYRLRELQEIYSQDFERVVAEVTGSDEYSAIPLAAILTLIKLAQDFTEYLINANYEAKRVKEEHLNQYLIEPYRFRDWSEIEMIEGDIYNNFSKEKESGEDSEYNEDHMNPELSQENTEETTPFEEEPASLKPKPKKKQQ